MKLFTQLTVITLTFLLCQNIFAVNRTWSGPNNGDFNTAGNWTPAGIPGAADNVFITEGNMTINMSANRTINNFTVTCTGGGSRTLIFNTNGNILTVNGITSVGANTNDEVELQCNSAPGGFIFNGNVTFDNGFGSGRTQIKAALAGEGSMTFNANLTTGANAFTEPGVEPKFFFDKPGTQSWTFNSTTSFIVPQSFIVGVLNSPTVNLIGIGSTFRIGVYDGSLTVNVNSTLDIGTFDVDNFIGGAMNLAANSLLRTGGTNTLPTGYTSGYTFNQTSTVEYYGTNQSVRNETYGNILFTGSGTKTSAGNFAITGNWTNNVTFAHGNDVHTFNGTANQTIGGTNLTTFYRITENKGSGKIILDRNTRAANRLTLTNGVFDLNGHDMRINAAGTNTVQRTNGYILSERTDMSSTFTRTINNSNGNKVFPFGTASGDYIPFTYSRAGGNVGRVTVATYTTAANNTPYAPTVTHMIGSGLPDNSASAVDRFWDIDVTGTINANLTYTYTNSEVPANGELNLRAQQWDSGGLAWLGNLTNITSQTSNAVANTVSANGVTNSISQWTLALDLTPLPIELISFNGECNKQTNQISWSTASEINNDYFSLEKSIDAKNFELVEQVDGAGNSNSLITYSSTDNSPYKTTYYRLKQTDFDGSFEYSKIISVKSCRDDIFDFIPFQKNTRIDLSINSNIEGDHTIEIMDLQGRNILSKQKYLELGTNRSSLNPNIRSGIYFVRIVNNNTQEMFIKK